ncbi:hypothetical protein DID88_002252 [Monilinia fructigena]|uniref:CCHC-type domain-containing protein n=1 Tax=Monilinia fructigena TaxID=38457 RepID=A0A395ID30_9HELO|nr:hypothetical protein DID88_002252 [Monilinia fructigena]
MSWEAAPSADDWGNGEAAATSGGDEWGTPTVAATSGGDEWGIPTVASSEQPGANAFNDGGAAENVYGGEYGSGEQLGGGGGGGFGGGCFNCGEEGHAQGPNAQTLQRHVHVSIVVRKDTPRPTAPTLLLPVNSPVPAVSVSRRAIVQPTAQLHLLSFVTTASRKVIPLLIARILARLSTMMSKMSKLKLLGQILIKQSEEGDFDDMKDEVMKYIKASPDATYPQLENAFRSQNIPIYLIATEKELNQTFTNMDLQGNLDRKYTVSWRKSSNHSRPKEKEKLACHPQKRTSSALQMLVSLLIVVFLSVPAATSSVTSQSIAPRSQVSVSVFKFSVTTVTRLVIVFGIAQFLARIGSLVVTARSLVILLRNAPEPRSAEGVECKNCNEIGHFSRDCPTGGGGDGGLCRNCNQPGHRAKDCTNERVIICRNCDAEGHTGKECQSLVIILAFSARTASRWATPRFDARSLSSTKMVLAMLLVTVAATAVAKSQPTLVLCYGGGDAATNEYAASIAGGDDNWGAGG